MSQDAINDKNRKNVRTWRWYGMLVYYY